MTVAPVSVEICASIPMNAAPAAGSAFTSACTNEAIGSITSSARFCISRI